MFSLYKMLANYLHDEPLKEEFLKLLEELVSIDCGTEDKEGVDAVSRIIERILKEKGWTIERLPQAAYGDCIKARVQGNGKGRIMLLGHLDTVYPRGTVAAFPFSKDGEIIRGPGVNDMKGGLLTGIFAVELLKKIEFTDFEEILFFFNSEEEVGSPVSTSLYQECAKKADAVLVLEAARKNGDIVSARKGSGEYLFTVKGRPAHAGVEPEKGIHAVLEMAHKVIELHKLNRIRPGITVNPGVISGGTKSNVIPEEARLLVDVRAQDLQEVEVVEEKIQEVGKTCFVEGTVTTVEDGFHFFPMAKTPQVARLVDWAKDCATHLGFTLNDTATGGASDANGIAKVGIPVLDGLGPIGGSAHVSGEEYLEATSILPRTALLAGIIARVAFEQKR